MGSACVRVGGERSNRELTLRLANDACRPLNHPMFRDMLELISTAISDLNYNRVKADLLHKCIFFIQHYLPTPTTMTENNNGKRPPPTNINRSSR